ncbi:PfkB family carbohydrate kinase [Microbacterium sp. LRZ72]|uniref:PfkB family carbohydrate kinase n=1 Tax=Microbacterium sp. LRZ72 TaxID=2942481 RepID=UPI0029BD7BAE|nr:PfkB family carbohydrate kinase [Microbacterium sp. LRZ72]MDX2376400.1 PfkB family carbohydrate kinase [Microbacterium sp. LRZ72]
MPAPSRFVVLGPIGRDLVLRIDGEIAARDPARITRRSELLGGKGANQAVGLRQLGAEVALVGVVGEDAEGDAVLEQAHGDGIDVRAVARRGTTSLFIDVVAAAGERRLLEHIPASALLTAADLSPAHEMIERADAVCLQLQQPVDALLPAARAARETGALVAVDGGTGGPDREQLLAHTDVVRADAAEAAELVDAPVDTIDDARHAAACLLAAGPRVVAVAVPAVGDLVAWPGGDRLLPHGSEEVVDPTGAGDAFFAGLVTGLVEGWDPPDAGRLAAAAAAATVGRLGGRPDLRRLRPA